MISLFAVASLGSLAPVTLPHRSLSPAELVVAQSVQGIANRDGLRVWLETGGIQEALGEDLRRERGARPVADVWALAREFKGLLKGVVVYQLGTPSVNAATSLAGVLDAVAVDASLLEKARTLGLPVLVDARGMGEAEVFDRYRDRFGKGIVVEQAVDKPGHLRDFAIRHRAMVIATQDNAFRSRVISAAGPTPLVFGWGQDEFDWVGKLSRAGASGVAADWCVNLSALESWPAKQRLKVPKGRKQPTVAKKQIAFVMSDGDNIQWLTGGFETDSRWFRSPLRGKFPVTWEVSPLLARFAPRVLERIYRLATPMDDFVAGPGLPGYCFAHDLPNREAMAKASARYLRDSGLRTVSFLNSNDGSLSDLAPWMRLREVAAAIYKDYAPYHRRRGEVQWIEGKPVMAYSTLLWEDLVGKADLVKQVRASQSSRILVNIHAWSYAADPGPLGAVQEVISQLGPDWTVVTANQLLAGLRKEGLAASERPDPLPRD